MPQIFEGIGGQLQTLGVPERAWFVSASALVNYILGVAGQNAANVRMHPQGTDRVAFLDAAAAQWARLDPVRYPFVHRTAAQLPEHDDREQFLAGIDLVLAGIEAALPGRYPHCDCRESGEPFVSEADPAPTARSEPAGTSSRACAPGGAAPSPCGLGTSSAPDTAAAQERTRTGNVS
ncbi:hypothetical protein GCM10010517_15860 [Streptosporangium fragile]|uniref:Tetracycline repressor TetR C-terminal domain-containing protein n=1 Tax=Streptosporangium fragile TaxID=46186 RepID=A0ABP6I8Y7_9ACTN